MNEEIESRPTCYRCYRPKVSCFCEDIVPFETNVEFCILMHPKEAKKSHIGTGRMANTALKSSRIVVDKTFDQNKVVMDLINGGEYSPFLLYPGEDALNISSEKFELPEKTPLIFILDGTWPCAKAMMRDSKILHNLPRISFSSEKESRYSIRHQPAKYCLSTIESIYVLIEELEKQGIENVGDKKEVLLSTLDKLVAFQKKCAADPNLNHYNRKSNPFKDPSKRTESKKWQTRKICFEDDNYS